MATEKILTDVPGKDVDQVVEDFKSEGCDPISKEEQGNGKWTVKAVCPDK